MSSHCPPADGDADAAGDVEDVDEPLPTGRLKRSQAPRLSCKKSARQRAEEDGYIDVANSEPPGSSEGELMEEALSSPPGDDGERGGRHRPENVRSPSPQASELCRSATGDRQGKGKGRHGPGWSAKAPCCRDTRAYRVLLTVQIQMRRHGRRENCLVRVLMLVKASFAPEEVDCSRMA